MPDLIHECISQSAQASPDAPALLYKEKCFSYAQLQHQVEACANALLGLGIGPGERVAIYLPKQPEVVFGLFGAAAAGACFVPINPLLKPRQLAHILPHWNWPESRDAPLPLSPRNSPRKAFDTPKEP